MAAGRGQKAEAKVAGALAELALEYPARRIERAKRLGIPAGGAATRADKSRREGRRQRGSCRTATGRPKEIACVSTSRPASERMPKYGETARSVESQFTVIPGISP